MLRALLKQGLTVHGNDLNLAGYQPPRSYGYQLPNVYHTRFTNYRALFSAFRNEHPVGPLANVEKRFTVPVVEEPKTAASLRTANGYNALARTAFMAPISAGFIPFEKALRKLISDRANGIKTNSVICLGQVLQKKPFQGYQSKMHSNFMKSGVLFGVESVVGGYPGFVLGGMLQGAGTALQQVLDHNLVPGETSYRQILQRMEMRELVKRARIPCAISAINGTFFWDYFTSTSGKKEQWMHHFFKSHGWEHTTLAAVSPFLIRFETGIEGGLLTYPAFRCMQMSIENPNFKLSRSVFGDTKPKTGKEAIRYFGTAIRRSYCSALPALSLFGVTQAVGLSVALSADRAVDSLTEAANNRTKRPGV